jgi:opacity protein-like surface antigen
MPMPPPMIYKAPVAEDFSGWYLRGDVGVGMMRAKSLDYLPNPNNPPNDFVMEHFQLGDTAFVGFGAGYEWNSWLRFDVTGEYRTKASVYAFGSYTDGNVPPAVFGDVYNGNLKSWVFLANAYVDLGTWWCFTPFVGAGIGGAYHTFQLADTGLGTSGRGFSPATSDWALAWAAHAGVAYNATKNLKVELAYRYLDMGSISAAIDCVGGCFADSYKLHGLTSHDIKLGLRWVCCEEEKPRPVFYQPQPSYVPPPPPDQPLMRKG